MKARIATFNIQGKVDIWCEYVKNVRGIHEEDLTWIEFKGLFKKKYLSKRYFDDREKEFYELNIRSMIYEEYTSRFLELVRYVTNLNEKKTNIQIFISGLPITFKDQIEFNEPKSLEEAI